MTPAALPSPIAATPPSMQAKPSPADREPAPKRPFASILQQRRDEAPPPPVPAAIAPPEATSAAPGDDAAAPADDSSSSQRGIKSPPVRPRVRASSATAASSAPSETASAATAAEAPAAERADDAASGRGLAAPPQAAEPWRAAIAVAPEATRSGAAMAKSGAGSGDDAEAAIAGSTSAAMASANARSIGAPERSGRDGAAGAGGVAGRSEASDAKASTAADVTSAALPFVESPLPGVTAGSPHHDGAGMAALGATAGTSATAPAEAAPPTASTAHVVATPLDSPDFAAAFGLQVSVLVKEGVQRAELHLNPTDMGPVSIHIALAGSEARIDFGADLAATRQAIEQGLPALAGALRDAGFTLAGGGVSQHAGDRRGGSGEGRDDRAGDRRAGLQPVSAATSPALARVLHGGSAGGVDLYA